MLLAAAVSSVDADDLAIVRRFPQALAGIPRVRLTNLPTPIERLHSLEREAQVGEIWVKRDDRSATMYGGNKPRKLEFILGDAVAEGKTAVLTTGGIGTHHGLATAICARNLKLRALLVLLKQPVTAQVRRSLLLDHAAGAELYYGSSVPRLTVVALRVCAREMLQGGLPYIVPTGGTSPLGILGYVNAAFELAEQVAAGEMPEPEWIFLPLGTGGTVAGLVAGARLAGLRSRVAAVLVTDILPPTAARLSRMANRALSLLRAGVPPAAELNLRPDDFTIIREYLGPSYGTPTDEARRARDLIARTEDIHLETTYTAKCLAAILGQPPTALKGPILFWNTYSSVDPAAHLGPLPDAHQLPKAFHRFFEGDVIEA
jgi:D-cysteine desulfhydrase